jgi:hypothetical protein
MEVGDCSLWHHLIFCEELEIDGNNKDVCWLCEESVLGVSAYKCLECSFLQHKSCSAIKMPVKHNLRDRHHLMFIEELGNAGNEEVVCPGCEEQVFGPAYKCSIPGCSFLLHRPCTELPHVIQHPVHSKHTLFLRVPSESNYCDACRKCCSRCFLYRCSPCDYDLDVKCRSRWRINAENCHQHAFVPTLTKIQFTCQVCGEERKDIAYLCSICQLLVHSKCARFRRTVEVFIHNHSLTLTYSLPQYKEHNNIFCKLCYKKVNTEYATYSCRECSYIAHLNCATACNELSKSLGLQQRVFDDDSTLFVHLVEGVKLVEEERASPREMEHFSHPQGPQHYLILRDEELMEDRRCEACMQFIISVPFYGCVKCNFFIHYRCAKLPSTIKRYRLDELHPLTLSQPPSTDGLFRCDICKRYRHGFTYRCDKCQRNIDVQCCLIPDNLEHEGHQHCLFFPAFLCDTCNACGAERGNFTCTTCKFDLCTTCATLPLVTKCKYDTHLLKLSYMREDEFEEYYCLICEEERDNPDHWFYYCVKCNFSGHPKCVLGVNPYINYGRTYIHEDHRHPLTFVEKIGYSPPCDVCDTSFKDMALECTRCKFKVHRHCLREI